MGRNRENNIILIHNKIFARDKPIKTYENTGFQQIKIEANGAKFDVKIKSASAWFTTENDQIKRTISKMKTRTDRAAIKALWILVVS